ncbi:DNA polymerase III subunit delta [Lachnospiraceae bacterium]|nr:DNA polymerase III subunit delta [Lachnospiraceae bacterium]
MKILNADLKSGEFQLVYLLYGEEGYLKRSYKRRFLEAFSEGGGMNCMVFEGKDIEEKAVIEAADTMPFFAARRLIVVEDSGWLKASTERLPAYLPSMPETTVLLFIESGVDKRNRLYQAIRKAGYACELNHPDEHALQNWAARYLATYGKKITPGTMNRFLSYVGDDMEFVKNELDKLIAYLGEEEVADVRAVDTVTSITLTSRIFELIAAITSRQTGKAMRLYEDLLALREPPMRILFLTARQYRQLLYVKELTAEGRTKGEVAKELKLPVGVVGRMETQSRSIPRAALQETVRQCAELEEKVKTGELQDRLAVEILICGAS